MMPALDETLRRQIRENGPLNIALFMERAVSHYYATRDPFGTGGDFTTAPEISQIFGELLGAWAADCWDQMGKPEKFLLMECGPGRGTLMADALRATQKAAGFHQSAQIVLLENSPLLKRRQAEKLQNHTPRWIESFNDPFVRESGLPLILLANEFLDALPIRQFQFKNGEWRERVVGLDEKSGAFSFGLSPFTDNPALPSGAQEGDIAEISPACREFVKNVCEYLARRGGAALFIDYGYMQGYGDTLQAVRNHRYADILSCPGDADLTAHVDFAALQKTAAGCTVFGPVTQKDFLQGLGIAMRAAQLKKNAAPEQAAGIDSAVHRLTAPDQMGTLFKVIAFSGPGLRPAGF